MIIKPRDGKERDIAALKELLRHVAAGSHAHSLIAKELAFVRAGNRAEEEMAFLLDHDYGNDNDLAVINDLRIDVGSRSAQIDHLLIHNTLTFFVVETKSVREGIRILDNREFLRWNGYRHAYEGMPSPLAQNERHIAVLQDALTSVLPGWKQVFVSVIAVSKHAQIKRTPAFDTRNVLKTDLLNRFVNETLTSITRECERPKLSVVELESLGRKIAAWHAPVVTDYAARFGIEVKNSVPKPIRPVSSEVAPHRSSTERNKSGTIQSPPQRSSRLGRRVGIAALIVAAVTFVGHRANQDASPRATTSVGKQTAATPTKQKNSNNQRSQTTRVVPAAVAGSLREGEDCFAQKRYDCAISSANAVLRIEPSNASAVSLKRRAELEQAQAMNTITIR